ncbi:MAG: methionine synthase [Candidatus Lokiarchaeota archaeon]|nr:methionine synthase [Candidatus Lokiarchaeota archaeon]
MAKANSNNYRKQHVRKILTACLGQCVHIAGVHNFMDIATQLGFDCLFLGPATEIPAIINKIKIFNPSILGLSYRLTPSTLRPILRELKVHYKKLEERPSRLFFAGTPETVKVAKEINLFHEFFIGGESKHKIISTLRNDLVEYEKKETIPRDLISRIKWKKPFPVIRAHFGLPNLRDTIEGIKKIADSEVLDIVSIAPDQNTQVNFFHPEDNNKELSGAGGVPIRSKEDLLKLNKARLTGNHPLLRIYAGTRDFIELAKLFRATIKNAWAAIPIFWFNQMDGRGPLTLKESIKQHLAVIKWHGENDIPVEINDAHHWSLRDAPDCIAVADMYLCGIIAKMLGVRYFIAQYMFNTPPASSFNMDLAKMLAKNELLHSLTDNNFSVIKQVRTGLASFPLDLNKAKGQLAAATMVQLTLKPDIVHVVSYSEANHVALPEDVIESCKIVDQVISRMYSSEINMIDSHILKRKEELIKQAKWIINLIPSLAKNKDERSNPYINPNVLNRLVKYGIFDAPHLKNNKFALGKIKTKIIDGECNSWDNLRQKRYDEIQRIKDVISNQSDIIKNNVLHQRISLLGDI